MCSLTTVWEDLLASIACSDCSLVQILKVDLESLPQNASGVGVKLLDVLVHKVDVANARLRQSGRSRVDDETVDAVSIVARLEVGHQIGDIVLSKVANGAVATVEVGREGHVLEEAACNIKIQLTACAPTVDEEVDWEDRFSESSEESRRDQAELRIVLDGILDQEFAILSRHSVVVFSGSVFLAECNHLVKTDEAPLSHQMDRRLHFGNESH